VYGEFGHDDQAAGGAAGQAAGGADRRPAGPPGGPPIGPRDPARLRVSDADRDRVAGELGAHFQAGRLTQDEFDERLGQAINARTQGDLDELLADLPADRPAGSRPAQAPAGQVAQGRRWIGPWAVTAVTVALFAVAAVSPGWHGRWAWWLIPLAFIAIRRLTWGGGGPRRW
jgi:hypothetical protein